MTLLDKIEDTFHKAGKFVSEKRQSTYESEQLSRYVSRAGQRGVSEIQITPCVKYVPENSDELYKDVLVYEIVLDDGNKKLVLDKTCVFYQNGIRATMQASSTFFERVSRIEDAIKDSGLKVKRNYMDIKLEDA